MVEGNAPPAAATPQEGRTVRRFTYGQFDNFPGPGVRFPDPDRQFPLFVFRCPGLPSWGQLDIRWTAESRAQFLRNPKCLIPFCVP